MKKALSLLFIISLLLTSASLFSCGSVREDEEVFTKKPGVDVNVIPEVDGDDAEKVSYVPETKEVEEVIVNGNYRSGNSDFVSEETVKKYPRLTNLPTLYITLDDGMSKDAIQHGNYTGATYTLVDTSVLHSYYEQRLQIKGRGNWSWSFAQKPYTLKLDSKADFLGMGDAKKWILVTVHSDKTMMHNYMTQKFAKALGLPGACDNEYVDVVINGKYNGTYVLTEKIQLHENRIKVEDNRGVLFEIEMVYRHSCRHCITLYENKSDPSKTIHLELMKYMDWDLDNLTREQNKEIKERMRVLEEFFKMVTEAMQTGDWVTLTQMIDVDSFINCYLLNELSRNYDSAFVTSVYCYINENNYLVLSPVWDFDTCYGAQMSDYNVLNVAEAPWYKWLLNCPEFLKLTKERWAEIRKEEGLFYDFYTAIDKIAEYFSKSEEMEHKLYPTAELLNNLNFKEAVAYFKEWLLNRIEFMDYNYLPDNYEHEKLDKTTTAYTKNKYAK